MDHPFFEALDRIEREGNWDAFDYGPGVKYPRKEFYRELKNAHVFVFDRKCSRDSLNYADRNFDRGEVPSKEFIEELTKTSIARASTVEEFSLPFKTCLYLFTGAQKISRSSVGREDPEFIYTKYGYLVREITPEKFRVFEIMECENIKGTGVDRDLADFFEIELKSDESIDKNASDIITINRLSNMISVKRIGIEKDCMRTVKTKGIGAGYTTYKFDRLYHIADKEEYSYSLGSGDVNFEFSGWWRGHWRAFYCKDSNGKHVRDQFGRNIVDYNRQGKDRSGEYVVPGYTWVVEHIKGDASLAEIKTHYVVNK